MLTANDFEYIFNDVNAEMVIYDTDDVDAVRRAAANVNPPPDVVEVDGVPSDVQSFGHVLESAREATPTEVPRNPGRIS